MNLARMKGTAAASTDTVAQMVLSPVQTVVLTAPHIVQDVRRATAIAQSSVTPTQTFVDPCRYQLLSLGF